MRYYVLLAFAGVFLVGACKKDSQETVTYEGYPEAVGKILVKSCAHQGCHNSSSKDACAGFDLSSWESMFKGTRNNAAVIPYRADQSFLFFSLNTYCDFGPQLEPVMPPDMPALNRNEVLTIRNWINNGAPDQAGFVKFSDHVNRSKIYVANQGCDLVTVFDAETKLIMRAFDVGDGPGTEAPHDMIVSPDGQYIYVSFYASNKFQKFRTSDQSKVAELTLTDFSWHAIAISGDSKIALTTHLDANGKATLIDLDQMKIIATYQGFNFLVNAHGCCLNHDGTLAYITSQQGNFLYKMDVSQPLTPEINEITLQPGQSPFNNGVHKPYAVAWFPDYSKYAVSCQGTNEVRVFYAANDSLLKTIGTSGVPQLMSFSKKYPYLFVSCMEDSANLQTVSQVDVIDYNSLQKITGITTGYQPRGLTVDDNNDCVWVANRNISAVGWAPHHTTACQGKNGYITIIDMNTLALLPGWKAEVSSDPYCISIRK